MKYTKEDLQELDRLVSELNNLISTKFQCSTVKIKTDYMPGRRLNIEVFERVSVHSYDRVLGQVK